jgi:hypothetical protein
MALPPTSRTSALRWLQGSDEAEAEPEPEPEPVVEEAKPTAEELADRPKTLYALEPAAGPLQCECSASADAMGCNAPLRRRRVKQQGYAAMPSK